MSSISIACAVVLFAFTAGTAAAQQSAAAPASPTVAAALEFARGAAKNIIQAATDMPADKYGFKPTPAQWSFGQVVAHVTDENDQSCDPILGRTTHPTEPAATASKEALIAALRASFDKCLQAFNGVTEAKLTSHVSYYGSNSPIVAVLFGSVSDWADHYAQLAIYMRLNGILPPTARQN